MTTVEKIHILELYGEVDIVDAPFNEHQFVARFFVNHVRKYVFYGETEDDAIDGVYDQVECRMEIECHTLPTK